MLNEECIGKRMAIRGPLPSRPDLHMGQRNAQTPLVLASRRQLRHGNEQRRLDLDPVKPFPRLEMLGLQPAPLLALEGYLRPQPPLVHTYSDVGRRVARGDAVNPQP